MIILLGNICCKKGTNGKGKKQKFILTPIFIYFKPKNM